MKLAPVIAALLLWSTAAAAAVPQRIVSATLCGDQYLIALSDKSQIAALSEYARDPTLSFYARTAQAWPIVRGDAESILPLKPDLIVGNPRFQTAALLRQFGLPILDIGFDNSFDDIVAHTRLIAAAIGHPDRGEALIAKMRAQLAQIPLPHRAGLNAVYYQRAGFVIGPGTLMDEMLHRAGLRNLATQLNGNAISQVDLETLVAAQPDVIVYTNDWRHARDWGAMLLNHPALTTLHSRRIYVPDTLTVCGGPSYPVAVAALYRGARIAEPTQIPAPR
jgi:iron complex transport system substrate-binding protein